MVRVRFSEYGDSVSFYTCCLKNRSSITTKMVAKTKKKTEERSFEKRQSFHLYFCQGQIVIEEESHVSHLDEFFDLVFVVTLAHKGSSFASMRTEVLSFRYLRIGCPCTTIGSSLSVSRILYHSNASEIGIEELL